MSNIRKGSLFFIVLEKTAWALGIEPALLWLVVVVVGPAGIPPPPLLWDQESAV